jgi:hypothetical protein
MAQYRPHGPHLPPGASTDDVDLVIDDVAVDDAPPEPITSVNQLATPRPKPRGKPRWRPGVQPDGSFRDRTGRVYRELDDVLLPLEARQFLLDPARVAFDRCGCGGDCGLMWVPEDRLGELATTYPQLHRHRFGEGVISSWKADDGTRLLLVQSAVVWGRLIR